MSAVKSSRESGRPRRWADGSGDAVDARTIHCPSTFQFRKDGLKAGIPEVNPVRIGEQVHHAVQLERVEGVSQLIQSAINVRKRGRAAKPPSRFGCACISFAESSL